MKEALHTIEEMINKYIVNCRRVLEELEPPNAYIKGGLRVNELIETAKNYLKDAEFYLEEKRFEVSLAAVAYCEGLLDALRLLGIAEFEW